MIDGAALAAIEAILCKGDRVEIIPVKGGVKVVRIRREAVKAPAVGGGDPIPGTGGDGFAGGGA